MNEVKISLTISNDSEQFPAIRTVSNKLTVVNTFLSSGRQPDGSYGASSNLEVKMNTRTVLTPGTKLEPKAHIDVIGFLSPESWNDSSGKKHSKTVIVAKQISNTVYGNNSNAEQAAVQDIPNASGDGFMDIPDFGSSEFPFQS